MKEIDDFAMVNKEILVRALHFTNQDFGLTYEDFCSLFKACQKSVEDNEIDDQPNQDISDEEYIQLLMDQLEWIDQQLATWKQQKVIALEMKSKIEKLLKLK